MGRYFYSSFCSNLRHMCRKQLDLNYENILHDSHIIDGRIDMHCPDLIGCVGSVGSDEDCTGIFRPECIPGTGHDERKDIRSMEAGGICGQFCQHHIQMERGLYCKRLSQAYNTSFLGQSQPCDMGAARGIFPDRK